MSSLAESEEINSRRSDELEALRAYYGDDLSPTLVPSSDDKDMPLDGPWFLRIRHQDDEGASSLGIPTLEIKLPTSYPLGDEAPVPILHNIMMNQTRKEEFLQELIDMYEGIEVAILWGERCREELLSSEFESNQIDSTVKEEEESPTACANQSDTTARIYIPSTTKFSQPIRNFSADIIDNPAYIRNIIRTPLFHPPKSGPSELMIAHVSSVHCIEHVQWVLAELLFNDKKVARASHNMFAYRFTKQDGTSVSDNDDDGEKGSGAKLASLLSLSKVENVLVIVSRWYGGIHLGPARFKHIASVARDGLVQAGFLTDG